MSVLLVTLIIINQKINQLPLGLIKAAFGIYLGWICIATVANVTALLVHYGWSGWGIPEETWAIIMILTGAIIAVAALYRLENPYLGLPVIWAFIGISIKRHSDFRSILLTAIIAIVVVSIFTLYSFIRKLVF
jgi:hypothetical protein